MAAGQKKETSPRNPPGRPQTRTKRLGALRHRALMLAMEGRYADAGRLLVAQLELDPGEAAHLGAEERRLVSVAATYLEKAGDAAGAAALFEALGNEERAALSRARPAISDGEGPASVAAQSVAAQSVAAQSVAAQSVAARSALAPSVGTGIDAVGSNPTVMSLDRPVSTNALREGKPTPPMGPGPEDVSPRSQAMSRARQLIQSGYTSEAADVLASVGLEYEAAVCRLKTGDFPQALLHLTRVAPRHERYPAAARTAARLLLRLGECAAEHVQFLQPLLDRPPEEDKEIELYLRLAALLEQHGHPFAARSSLESVLRRTPGHEDAAKQLERLLGASGTPTLDPPERRARRADRPIQVRVSTPPAATEEGAIGPGAILGDRFRLESELGRGGMATVFSARDLELDEQVALKVFSSELVTQEWMNDAVERFRQELKLCRKLRHPNIIQVYDIGIHAGHRYFTMELLRGHSLERYLGQPVDLEWGLDCLTQAGVALHAAHEMGIVHRDVKPENLFVTETGLLKVMDFGIAKSSYQRGKTQVGTFAGTPEYMAPEQISDFSAVGPAADQYALGCVGYELFTGRVPFAHAEMMPLLMMHIERQPEPLRSLNPALPAELDAIILKMMAKHPSDRFPSLHHVTDALAQLRE